MNGSGSGRDDAEEGELVDEVLHKTISDDQWDLKRLHERPQVQDRRDRKRERRSPPRSRQGQHSRSNIVNRSSRYEGNALRNGGDAENRVKGTQEEEDEEDEDDQEYQNRILAALQTQEEDEDRIIEERRRRRQEILSKHGVCRETPNEHQLMETLEHDEGLQDDATQRDVINSNPETLVDASEKQPVDQIESNQAPSPSADDDMFADTPEDDANNERKQVSTKGLKDNYDDAEGYYNFQVGEVIGSRYEVFATHGRGVFSSVLRARDLRDYKNGQDKDSCPQVAVKVIRANDTMYKAGQTEKVILNKLLQADPEGKKHCIRMLNSFEYRNHLCLVFEPMAMNLRDLTKKYGRGIGLSLNAVRVYATQMFIALLHLKTCGVLHADIKPDNILINERRTAIKICDFGSAMFSGDNEITPYLVSRFYRAPEVILGLPYDYPMDMWSIGCVIFELCTGQILFKGRSNNEMLKYMMDVKGPFPKKMLKKAEFAFRHFDLKDATMSFALEEQDPVTKQPIRRIISNPTKKEGLSKLLMNESDNKKKLLQLVDLLERIFVLEPEKRITPLDALKHPFIVSEATPKNPHLSQTPRSLKQQKS